ncbi:MAG TPA: hypothetical protein VFD30_03025 [Terriglobia bacterium]|jgi:hypothetical protein|nr:hypothetical protein [Terriglobia bacterium]
MKGVRIIEVAGEKVGLTGLDATLERFYLEGWSPGDPGLEAALVEALRDAGNYITPSVEDAYQAALRDLYQKFYGVNAPRGVKSSSPQGGRS